MSRISKLFTGLCTAALFMIILAAPVKADLASDAAWVQAQAQAGLKSAQAALDAAYAMILSHQFFHITNFMI